MMSQKEKFIKIISDPNKLTLFRIAASPVIIVFMLFPNTFCTFMAALVFSIAAAVVRFVNTRGVVVAVDGFGGCHVVA